jgi:hypothetical protein
VIPLPRQQQQQQVMLLPGCQDGLGFLAPAVLLSWQLL